ncbi:UNKNOWN [Stylonychia lemnae]|uniref:Uncharacterized protein n=1 Tax=Stylonychia lemnae TaxID=5949 RepID=A0A078AQN9_STYLE|nr:UNKNOWN [Stylonychia lemnae]|eukprot:CDW84246.1 UNKNOWN [Stylonychia lemnae]
MTDQTIQQHQSPDNLKNYDLKKKNLQDRLANNTLNSDNLTKKGLNESISLPQLNIHRENNGKNQLIVSTNFRKPKWQDASLDLSNSEFSQERSNSNTLKPVVKPVGKVRYNPAEWWTNAQPAYDYHNQQTEQNHLLGGGSDQNESIQKRMMEVNNQHKLNGGGSGLNSENQSEFSYNKQSKIKRYGININHIMGNNQQKPAQQINESVNESRFPQIIRKSMDYHNRIAMDLN